MTGRASTVQVAAGVSRRSGVPFWLGLGLVLLALALQSLLPTAFPVLRLVNLPLLAALYLVLGFRIALIGVCIGAVVGWAHDGLTHGPIGVYGLVYCLLGYLVSVASQLFKIDVSLVMGLLVGVAYWLHELGLFAIREFVLGLQPSLELATWTALALLHTGLALVIFPGLDRLARPR